MSDSLTNWDAWSRITRGRSARFRIQVAIIHGRNKFEYKLAPDLSWIVGSITDSDSTEEYFLYFYGIVERELETIDNELRTAHPRSPLRLTFRNELHVVMMRIMPGAEHERVGVGLYTEILVKSPSIPSCSYKPLMGLGAAPSGVSDVNDKEGGSCLRLRTRVGSPGNLGLP